MRNKITFILIFVLTVYTLIGCNDNTPSKQSFTVIDWKAKEIDSVELIYYPDYNEQKEFTNQIKIDTFLQNRIKENIQTDTIGLESQAYQYKVYLFNNGEPYKTLYISTAKGNEFLSYVINGNRFYHPLSKDIQLALQE